MPTAGRFASTDALAWEVAYYPGQLPPVLVSSEDADWADLPTEGVLWVDVFYDGWHIRLQGKDNYWVHGREFGSWNDSVNRPLYQGLMSAVYRAEDGRMWRVPRRRRGPRGTKNLAGITIPDDEARELGLI